MVSAPARAFAAPIAFVRLAYTLPSAPVSNGQVWASGRPALYVAWLAPFWVAFGSTKNVAGTSRPSSSVTRGANRPAGRRAGVAKMLLIQDRPMVQLLGRVAGRSA